MAVTAAPLEKPPLNCDLVMKGGITSGVVYPLAACELATRFRFKSIGGASAGAIAAAAAAAAEMGRARGAFAEFAQLPNFLGATAFDGKNTKLFYLFQPQPGTRGVFRTLVAALGGGRWAWLRVLLTGFRNFPGGLILGALLGIWPLWDLWRNHGGLSLWNAPGLLLALLLFLLSCAGWTFADFVWRALRAIPENSFGLCSGMHGAGSKHEVPLTQWLYSYLNQLAGLDPSGRPLTFGDLWGAGGQTDPDICLEMMTTCLTQQRPFRLPFRDDETVRESRQFCFSEDDFRMLFPPAVVDWMIAHQATPANAADPGAGDRQRKIYPLPEPKDMPVVVAVRMSLSFPVLLSAVRLYSVDRARKSAADRVLEPVWFSDGGIGANFPLHLFDAPLPSWPTFGIDLEGKHPDSPAGLEMPTINASGILPDWDRFQQTGGRVGPLPGFVGAIIGTMHDWNDQTQSKLPGFRDRVATIRLTAQDGGLNLNMPADRIARLSEYGQKAGAEFVSRFADDAHEVALNWTNHRWVRMRTFLSATEEMLVRLAAGCAFQHPDGFSYDHILGGQVRPPSYNFAADAQRELADAAVKELCATGRKLQSSLPPDLAAGAPHPRPELRPRPRV